MNHWRSHQSFEKLSTPPAPPWIRVTGATWRWASLAVCWIPPHPEVPGAPPHFQRHTVYSVTTEHMLAQNTQARNTAPFITFSPPWPNLVQRCFCTQCYGTKTKISCLDFSGHRVLMWIAEVWKHRSGASGVCQELWISGRISNGKDASFKLA